jgi:hypothetical protein
MLMSESVSTRPRKEPGEDDWALSISNHFRQIRASARRPAQSPRAEQGKRALHAIRSGMGHAGRRATKISLPKLPLLEKLKP